MPTATAPAAALPHRPDIAALAALIGDPARASMLTALMGGRALTAGELVGGELDRPLSLGPLDAPLRAPASATSDRG